MKTFDRKSISKSRSEISENVRKYSGNLDFHWKFWKIEKSKISKNFQKILEFWLHILKSIFYQKFSLFFYDFFLNRFRIFWIIQKWKLEVPRTRCGRVSERNVEVGRPQGPPHTARLLISFLASPLPGAGTGYITEILEIRGSGTRDARTTFLRPLGGRKLASHQKSLGLARSIDLHASGLEKTCCGTSYQSASISLT